MRLSRLFAGLCVAAPAIVGAQVSPQPAPPPAQPPRDSAASPGTPAATAGDTTSLWRLSPLAIGSAMPAVSLALPTLFATTTAGRFTPQDARARQAERRTVTLMHSAESQHRALWGETAFSSLTGTSLGGRPSLTASPSRGGEAPAAAPPSPPDAGNAREPGLDPGAAVARADSAGRDTTASLFGDYADLGLAVQARVEAKGEKSRNDNCTTGQFFTAAVSCRGTFQPTFDFQFNVRSGGVVADRVHVNVDYDSEREFDASNNVSVYYQGRPDEMLHRLEIGNVTFTPPPSRFITAGIPSGNYGLQAIGQLGPMRFRTIVARQQGNVVRDRVFTVGDRTLQAADRDIEDYQVEARRFFFTVDPSLFGGRYPNIDLLDRPAMATLAASLPDTVRPTKIFLYRRLIGGQTQIPNAPKFFVRGAKNTNRLPGFELLREGVDYYLDESQLWLALVRPLSLNAEQLVVAYRVTVAGRDTVVISTGGTPDTEETAAPQYANLIWEPEIQPGDDPFDREIRSVYRIGGDDIRRETVGLKIVTGSGGDQEKPVAGTRDTYLEMFRLSQSSNPSTFDVENRLWPRPSDPNVNRSAGGTSAKLIRDYFLVFPSLEPFAARGLVEAGNPANDTIYTTPAEDLYSTRHPQTLYHIRARYQAEGGGDAGTLGLGAVQVRQNSERLVVDGYTLRRGIDYTVDYELGTVSFTRPDTLFPRPRQVTVQFEENPLFAAAPTSIFGLATQFPLQNGEINLTAISQSQSTSFTRPPLGLEPVSSLVAGISGQFTFDAAPLTRALDRLPFVRTAAPSQISVQGELATSRPRPNDAGFAYVESFEGEGGTSVALSEGAWYFGSQPALGTRLPARLGAATFELDRASTLAWQNFARYRDGALARYTIEEIDPLTRTTGDGFAPPEQLLWLTLYPLRTGGLRDDDAFQWRIGGTPAGRRWRSIRTSLGPSGTDLTRVEHLEFWALVDTSAAERSRNPALVFDFGEISENSVAFAPESLCVGCSAAVALGLDSLYTGKQIQGLDRLDTERDEFSQIFDVARDDTGLPGDVVEQLRITAGSGIPRDTTGFATCTRGDFTLRTLGDARTNCTVRNNRLDEEDLDLDNVLNLTQAQRDSERLLRYIVDMSDARTFSRIGNCDVRPVTTVGSEGPLANTRCWVHFKIPFHAPDDSLNDPNVRRMRALRVTMVSGAGEPDSAFTTVPLARVRLVGSPWLKRADAPVRGVAGERQGVGGGYVIASIIGTMDRDSLRGIFYEPPPGVVDQAEQQQTGTETTRFIINERSMRLLAGGLEPLERAEAYYRFPEGQKNFMGYQELRVWARGRNNGWGPNGELQFFIKIGRDANNFYLYRQPAMSGPSRAAWEPEIVVDFAKLYRLRAEVQNTYLHGGRRNTCTGVDSLLIASSGVPPGYADSAVYAACADGYIVYTADPGVAPPNLAAVQELAVGMVRVRRDTAGASPTPIALGDTLELWVDDIRLGRVVDSPGFAGQLALSLVAGDVATLRVNLSRRDAHFRQLAEQPSFIGDNSIDVGTSVALEKLLPERLGIALPLSVNYTSAGTDPTFVSRSDIRGGGIDGLRTPKSSATSYALALRRTTPLSGTLLAPLLNNLSLSSTFATADSRSEYQTGTARSLTVGAEYAVAANARVRRLPGWLDRGIMRLPDWLERSAALRSMRGSSVRWNPTLLRFTSAVARNSDRRFSFSKPAETSSDTGRLVQGLNHVWRNTAAMELRPFTAITARWDVSSLRDLRDYGDTSANAVLARAERSRLLGMDVGLERERAIQTSFAFAPAVTDWIRPRIDFGTQFSLLRDPNARTLLREQDSTGAYHLPRRFNNSQVLSGQVTVDLGRALAAGRDSGIVRRLAGVFLPLDVSVTRSLLSSFDGSPFTPGVGYQLALGGTNDFRETDGRRASSAGRTTQLAVTNGLSLPFGTNVASRYQRTQSSNWTRRLDGSQGVVEGENTVFPDVSLRWTFQPAWLRSVVSGVGAQARLLQTRQLLLTPGAVPSAVGERSVSEVRSYPMNATVTWAFGGLSTSAGYSLTEREESRPGGFVEGQTMELNADIARAFRLPPSWGIRNDVRTRIGFQRAETESWVLNRAAAAQRSRLADNGRRAFSLNADTDLSETMSFSLVASRIVTFDENQGRRFTQNVLTAVLQLQFFGGEMR